MAYSKHYDNSFLPSAPVIDVTVSVPDETKASSRTIRALIDSGADITFIPQYLATELELAKVGKSVIIGYDKEIRRLQPIYSASISISSMSKKIVRVSVIEDDYALIGRDLINHWTVTLHGKKGIVEIEEG